MAGQTSALRRQLKSVKSTQKITNAMALVSTAKLQRVRGKAEENRVYSRKYYEMMLTALSSSETLNTQNQFFKEKDFDNPLHIIITGNSGLCGSYNIDMLKYVEAHINKTDPIFAIGNYGIKWLHANGYMVIKTFENLDEADPSIMALLIYDIIELFKNNEISSVDILYTQYINTLNYSPSTYELLPLKTNDNLEKKDIELVPNQDEFFDHFVPLFVSSVTYSAFLEARASEHAARRSAMDSANNNAEELIDSISLKINKARQSDITQEVTEIIAGAEAV